MKTQTLFGIQFAKKQHYKKQLLDSFIRWKSDKQWFLAREQNQIEVITKIVKKHDEDFPHDKRSTEEVVDELKEQLDREIEQKEWKGLYDELLGEEQIHPDREGGPIVYRREVKSMFEESDCKHFYFTETALKECNKFEIGNSLNLELLRPVPDGKRQFNFGHHFIRYEKKGMKIVALAANFTPRQEANYLQHTFFHFDLEKLIESPKLHYDHVAVLLKSKLKDDFGDEPYGLDDRSHELLFRMIAFIDLAEAEQIFLPAGQKSCYKKSSPNYLKNQETFPITVVTANWNRWLYLGTRDITGHWKKVACGPGRKDRVDRYVESYIRRSIILKPQKLTAVA